jgi:anti-sigma regulatory factor (Ser/Thr protein kinase)
MDESLLPPHLPCMIRAEQTHLRIPSRPDWIAPTAEFLQRKAVMVGACPAERGDRLLVALHEALSNAIVHGNLEVPSDLKERGDNVFAESLAARAADPRYASRSVDIQILYNGQHCHWVLTQEGPGFNVERVLGRQGPGEADTVLSSGRGILMMRAFVDDVHFCAGGRQVTLTVRKAGCPEKRRDQRRPIHEVIRVAPVRPDGSVDWDAAHDAVARNLSAGGMGLLQARLASTDQVLLGIATGGEVLYVPAEVRHCRALGEHEFELGCRFRPPAALPETPPAPEVEAAIGTLGERLARQRAVPEERRAHPRFVYTERITLPGGAPGEPAAGYARDLSKGGISFITTAPLRTDVRVLELPQGGGRPLRVRARVVRCTRIMDGFYDVGAHFLGLEA